MSYIQKFKGQGGNPPPAPPLKQAVFVWVGAFIAAATIAFLAYITKEPLILGSFGASIFVLFIIPDTPFAQPRNMVGGHVVSTLMGLIFYHYVSTEWWSMALALAFALTAMQMLRVPHPPAGSNPFIVFLAGAGWDFLLIPTLVGSVILVLVAMLYNNISSERSYPKYWF